MNIFPVKPVNPVHKFFLCGLATLREDHNPVNLVNRVKNSGLYVDAIAGQTTLYYNDPEWRVLAEYNGSGALQGTIVWGNYIDEALRMRAGESDYYYLHDHWYKSDCPKC